MNSVFFILELIGTVAFSLSGALTAMKRNMDIFGTCVLGMTTAVGGGIIRDLMLGVTPPTALYEPVHSLLALAVAACTFLPFMQRFLSLNKSRVYEALSLGADSLGLGIFTVIGVNAGFAALATPNVFLSVFLGVITGVGGGVLRDVMAGQTPRIFVKHVYASAALVGALLCALLRGVCGELWASVIGTVVILVLRLLAATFHWKLPKPRYEWKND